MTDDKNRKTDGDTDPSRDQNDGMTVEESGKKTDESASAVPSVKPGDTGEPEDRADDAGTEDGAETPEPVVTPVADVAPVAPAAAAPRRADWLARGAALVALGIAGVSGYAMYMQGAYDPLIKGTDGPVARITALENRSGGNGAELAGQLTAAAQERTQIADRLAALQQELAAVKSAGSSATPAAVPLPENGQSADGGESLATMQSEIEALKGVADQVADMQAKLAELTVMPEPEENAATVSEPEDAGLKQADPHVLAQLATLQGGYLSLQKQVNEQLDVMQQGIERRVADLRATYETRLRDVEKMAADIASTPRGADRATIDRAALVLALGRMQQAAESGRPFDASWRAARALDADGVVAGLEKFAMAGVPSVAQLAESFAGAADDAVTAERLHGASGWLAKTTQRAAAAITVRRTGELGGDDAEALVARAEMRLAEGDLPAALAELDQLAVEPTRAMAAWRSAAEQRHALDQAVVKARQNLFGNLAKGDGS